MIPVETKKRALDNFEEIIEQAYALLEHCHLCPRSCGADRLRGEKGYCGVGSEVMVSSFGPHFGEEAVLVGAFGSGAIFLTSCNLSCCFCQNYSISHLRQGQVVSISEFAGMMISLQEKGCHNINFVTPTPYVPQILKAVSIAWSRGLFVPLVYNCGGYESVETLKLLDEIIDVYMPDAKYSSREAAQNLSRATDYPERMKAALKEMYRQVGNLVVDEEGLAVRGLLIRHLVLPNDLAGTEDIMHFIATQLSLDAYVNIMDQYRPEYKAWDHPEINRPITHQEYRKAVEIALREGLHRGFRSKGQFKNSIF